MAAFIRFLALLVATSFALPALAQSFPTKPLRWIVPFPPGGSTDTFSRVVALKFAELIGQPVILENVPGAGASLGMDKVAKSAPDGYTIGLGTTGTHAINPHIYPKLPHDTSKDFTPLTLAVRYANVLVVHPNVPVSSVAELITYAKANPGKVTFGSAGNGSSNHLSGEVLKVLTGAPMTHVPYKGSGPAMNDLIAGNLTFMFDVLVTSLPQIQAGRVKPLAITTNQRSPFAPQIATMAEVGVKGFNEAGSELWFGLVGPAGMPKPVIEVLNKKLIEALRHPDTRQRLSAQGFELWTSSPEEFARVIAKDRLTWGKIVKASGASVN